MSVLIMPLGIAAELQGSTINLSEQMMDFVTDTVAEGFTNVAIGIASIMLIVLSLYYITSILDGGKFQIKMLLPVLMFFFVCNFSWISVPVTGFTRTLSQSLCDVTRNRKQALFEEYGGPGCNNILDLFYNLREGGVSSIDEEMDKKAGEDAVGMTQAGKAASAEAESESDEKVQWYDIGGRVKEELNQFTNEKAKQINEETSLTDSGKEKAGFLSRLTFMGVLASILNFINSIISFALQALGIVMTAVIVAFGPITFAFALLPGRLSTITTWFIRLCQFALYAPLVSLIDCFIIKIMCLFHGAVGSSNLMLFAVMCTSMVVLTAVPTISSMIIEGASGAVSLTGGLQAFWQGASVSSSVLMAGGKGVASGSKWLGQKAKAAASRAAEFGGSKGSGSSTPGGTPGGAV